jgi:Spy/CpxP family protein refolding chaperone
MRAIRCAVAALLAAGIVTVVGAQQPFRPGGGGGGFDVNTLILSNKVLQEELKVTDAQKEKFKAQADKTTELFKGMTDKFKDAKGDKDKFREIGEEMQKEGAKLAVETMKLLDEQLTADQKKRLKQIGVQMLGTTAFAEPDGKTAFGQPYPESQKATMKEVADALKLTDSQKSKIKDILTEQAKDRDAIRKDVFGDTKGGKGFFDQEKQKDFREKTAKLTAETMGKIADALDDAQKKAWKEVTGEPFDTSRLFQQPKKD